MLSDNFTASLGGFYAASDSNLSANGSVNTGTDINFEDNLGFDNESAVFLGHIKWRFTKNFFVSLEYLSINREASATLLKDITWKDYNFATSSHIDSKLDIDMSRLFVGYSFLNSNRYELGAGVGLHLMNIDATLAGNASINGIPVAATVQSSDYLAPLPNIGFYGTYAFSPKTIVKGRVDWFSATVDEYDGTLLSFAADIQYQAFKHVGLGLGYHYLKVDVEANKNNWSGQADYAYHGPKLFMTINF